MWIVNCYNYEYDEPSDTIFNYPFEKEEDARNYAEMIAECYAVVSVNILNQDPPLPQTQYYASLCFFDRERISYHNTIRLAGTPLYETDAIRVDESGRVISSILTGASNFSRANALIRVAQFWEQQDYKVDDFQYIGGSFRSYVLRSKIVDGWFYTRDNVRINVENGRWQTLSGSRWRYDRESRVVGSG